MVPPKVGDIGTDIVVQIQDENGAAVDVSTASEKTLYFTPPSQTPLALAAVNDSTGTDGKIKYTLRGINYDFNRSGDWKISGFVTIGLDSWTGDAVALYVAPSARYPGL